MSPETKTVCPAVMLFKQQSVYPGLCAQTSHMFSKSVRSFAVDFDYNNLSILATCKSILEGTKPNFWCKSTIVFR
jgi:hypothetical protein